ncbi:hypothetical protein EHS25_005384 [Saitozyma podzolica]|uniref:Uncharacterized protein n=1 Tax=Saitozyma podzolica TaxID=1890683 RepID=A0A427XY47_9TREE|nr:hypothetical protein EHS25_005384 [Saitozyma podzolica]
MPPALQKRRRVAHNGNDEEGIGGETDSSGPSTTKACVACRRAIENKDLQTQIDELSARFVELERVVLARNNAEQSHSREGEALSSTQLLRGHDRVTTAPQSTTDRFPGPPPVPLGSAGLLADSEHSAVQRSQAIPLEPSGMDRMVPSPSEPDVRARIGGARTGGGIVGVPPKQHHPSSWISPSAMSACFDIFYDNFHRWSYVLDKSTQTAAKVADSCPLLLATADPTLRWILPTRVNDLAQHTLRHGLQCVEWNHASYEYSSLTDRSAFFLNNAISMARDLRLDVVWPPNESDPVAQQRAETSARLWTICHHRDQL